MLTYAMISVNNILVSSSDSDRFALWVVIAIHRIDTQQHANAKQHYSQH